MQRLLKRLGLAAAMSLLLMGGTALAHPNHKVMGTVTMIAEDHVMVKDRAGKEHTIKLVKTTKVTKNKKAIKPSDITNGTRVVITVVSDENPTATLIEVGVSSAPEGRL